MTQECEVLTLRLKMEYARFQDWGDITCLADHAQHDEYEKMKINRPLVLAILGEIKILLKDLRKVSLRHTERILDGTDSHRSRNTEGNEDTSPTKMGDLTMTRGNLMTSADVNNGSSDHNDNEGTSSPSRTEDEVTEAIKRFGGLSEGTSQGPWGSRRYPRGLNHIICISKGLKDTCVQPRRWVWALKDKKLVEDRLHRLKQLTDFLHETASDSQREWLRQAGDQITMGMLQLTKSISDINQFLKAQNQHNGSMPTSETPLERITRFSIVASKALESVNQPTNRIPDTEIINLNTGIATEGSEREVCQFQGHHAWIEWKRYREISVALDGVQVETQPDPFVVSSVERLVTLLKIPNRPEEFCIPDCKGYFEVKGENPRFGLIYSTKETGAPQPLSSLFEKDPPTLNERLMLAQRITEGLGYLHTVNWLHKGIRSANVLLVRNTKAELCNVYLSGLEYARLDEAGLTNTAPVEDHQWGVLGIVLLEIAHWKQADELLGFQCHTPSGGMVDGKPKNLSDLKMVRDVLLKRPDGSSNIVKSIRNTMGDKFYEVVQTCLKGMEALGLNDNLDQTDSAIATLLQQAYLDRVVNSLKGIRV
ncbi:hypothetical protein BU24DRAFT_462984 [Aaosphaeria arxii CBS 175.79]|uniref:Prion-inhibition and propagation HeLo domain-containing protein n=1 Tax=Aaosphaeria arxii CBS 175.79 TaxID=1450172 RepID=A0A6A5XMK0_9PLEO|nr:uncharacterized protein BU24DRAFT_462984 [Aaosphaeria arxii CBS 175.79]KAF2014173.1 hypothetical protein BU24DRAFT_462984 [Aaosphaeria arxii CBS 175.79]